MAKRVCRGIALVFAIAGCNFHGVQGCPPKTAAVTVDCHAEVQAGRMTKDKCESLIEESCP